MTFRTSRRRLAIHSGVAAAAAIAIAFALALAGCNDKKKPAEVDEVTLESLWPNADGTEWRFTHRFREREDSVRVYASEDEVPDAPSLDAVEDLLGVQPFSDPQEDETEEYRLYFNGLVATDMGIEAQNLVEESVSLPARPRTLASRGGTDPVLAHVLRARPDLRARAEAIYGAAAVARLAPSRPLAAIERLAQAGRPGRAASPAPIGRLSSPLHELPLPTLLHGGPWKRTAEFIGTYTDLDTLPGWKFLTSNLADGAEFTHQLVRVLADDVFLHARILGRGDFDAGTVEYEDAVTCLYLVDYGILELTTELDPGGPIGFARHIMYGTATYAPGTGPVGMYQRDLVSVGSTLSEGVTEAILTIKSYEPGE